MASIDLKDASYSVPIAQSNKKFLKLRWETTLYQYKCLPNRLSCALHKFTKLLKPVLATLHKKGHIIVTYIDDLYLQGTTSQHCLKDIWDTFWILTSMGFVIQYILTSQPSYHPHNVNFGGLCYIPSQWLLSSPQKRPLMFTLYAFAKQGAPYH